MSSCHGRHSDNAGSDLAAVDVAWNRAQRAEVRDFVLWLRTCRNPARNRRRPDAPAPGSVNPRTGKDTCGRATPQQRSTLRYWPSSTTSMSVPVPDRSCRRCHHARIGAGVSTPATTREPFRLYGRNAYRQKQPDLQPRAVRDAVLADLFADLDAIATGCCSADSCPAAPARPNCWA